MSTKVNTTLSIDKDIKNRFKGECALNSVDMSETVEQLMSDYIELSSELRNERLSNGKEE